MAEKDPSTVYPPPSYNIATASFQGQHYEPQNNQFTYPPQSNYYSANANYPPPVQPITRIPQTSYGFSNIQNTVVVQSPQTASLLYQAPPPDYTVSAWLACLCCFWPTGLLAIIKAHQAHDAAARGDMSAANDAANSARQLVRVSIIVGVCGFVMAAVIVVIATTLT